MIKKLTLQAKRLYNYNTIGFQQEQSVSDLVDMLKKIFLLAMIPVYYSVSKSFGYFLISLNEDILLILILYVNSMLIEKYAKDLLNQRQT